jgi:hypothetical protein
VREIEETIGRSLETERTQILLGEYGAHILLEPAANEAEIGKISLAQSRVLEDVQDQLGRKSEDGRAGQRDDRLRIYS